MAIPFLHNINLSGNEIQNVKLHNTSSAPVAAAVGNQGQLYFNTTASSGLSGAGKKVYISTDVATTDTYAYQALAFESWVSANFNNYSLPLAADGTRGGIQIGYAQNNKNYPVELDSEKAFVNVPWTDTVYTHPDHTGHVTSTGDGITVLTVAGITGQTELTSGLDSADEFVISDDGVIKRMDVSVLQTFMQDNLTFTTDTNTDTLQTISSDSDNADRFITTVANAAGAQQGLSHSTLKYNPSTETLKVTNLIISGTQTTINTETINLADNIITLNSNFTGDPDTVVEDAGIEVERGTGDNVKLFWDESEDAWTVTNTTGDFQILQAAGSPGGKIKVPLTVDASPAANNVTSVTKSSNKYTINHSLATQDLIIQIVDISGVTPTYETVFADIERPTTGTITVDFANAVTDGDYKLLATQI
jgi:hypothetical protein